MLDAAFAVVGEVGFAGATIDAIARRSGVARSTIYRHWPDRSDLLIEAMSAMVGAVESVSTGHLHSDLVALALQVGGVLESEPIGSVIATAVLESRRDADLDRLRIRFIGHRRDSARALVATAVERGELPDSTEPLDVVEELAARVFFRVLGLREPVDAEWADDTVARMLARYRSVGADPA